MAAPAPRTLAESLHAQRRAYLVIAALVIAYVAGQFGVGVYLREHLGTPGMVRLVFLIGWIVPVALIGLAVLIHYGVRGRFRRRPAELLVTTVDGTPAFIAPSSGQPWTSLLIAALTGGAMQLGANVNAMGASGFEPLRVSVAVVWLLVIVFPVGLFLVGLRRGNQRLALTPAGVRLPTRFGSRFATWDELLPGGPRRPIANEPVLVRLRSTPSDVHVLSRLVRQDFIADVLRYYVEHPAQRPVIGTTDEYARIRATLELSNP